MNNNRIRFQRQNAVTSRILEEVNSTLSNNSFHRNAPIRIQYDVRLLETRWGESAVLDDEIHTILNEILPQVTKILTQVLYVLHPFNETNQITVSEGDCRVYNPLNNSILPDVSFSNVDLVVIVGGDLERNCAPRQLAYARPCTLDLETDRPIIGKLQFCLDNRIQNHTLQPSIYEIPLTPFYENATGIKFRDDHLQISLLEIALHEMVHILGFSSQLFPYFRDETGAPRMMRDSDGVPLAITRVCGDGNITTSDFVPSDNIVQVVPMEDGSFHQYFVTPTVQAVARNHFHCDSLLGGRLADSSNCISSHWHERHSYGDLMGPKASRSSENTLSLLTLALLADSGWYHVNFGNAQAPAFGRNAGCNFVYRPCIDNSTDQVPEWIVNEFCDVPYIRLDAMTNSLDFLNQNIFCDPSHRSWTLCDLVQYDNGSVPVKSYFSSSQLAPLNFTEADFCPIPDVGLGLDCRMNFSYTAFYPGESVGEGSRCINGFYTNVDSIAINITYRPACMHVTCDADAGMVWIGQGQHMLNCSADGEKIPIPTQPGSFFLCPRLAAVCPELYTCTNGCFGNGKCIHPNNGSRPYCGCFNETNSDVSCAPSLFAEQPSPSLPGAPFVLPVGIQRPSSTSWGPVMDDRPPSNSPIMTASGSDVSTQHTYFYFQWIVLLLLLSMTLKFY